MYNHSDITTSCSVIGESLSVAYASREVTGIDVDDDDDAQSFITVSSILC